MLFQVFGAALLVALRVVPAVMLVPVFGGVLLRPLVRFAMALALALALGSGALAWPRWVPSDGWFLVVAGRELTLGVAMALVLSAPFFAVRYAGEMLDAARGRPLLGAGAPRVLDGPLTTMLQATTAAIFVAAGAHRGVLRALAGTWREFPIDAAPGARWRLGELASLAARWVARSLEASLSLAASALLALLVTELALAGVARVSRPVARAGVDVPLRALAPLLALALALVALTESARPLMESALTAVRGAR